MDRLPRRFRQGLTRRDACAQRRDVGSAEVGNHCAVGGGRCREHGYPMALDRGEQRRWRGLLNKVCRGAYAHRKDHALTEPKRECERRASGEQVIPGRSQHVARERVRDGEDVAMEMHRRFGLSSRARREGEHAYVVGGGRHVAELDRLARRELGEVVRRGAAVQHCCQPGDCRRLEIRGEAMVANRHLDLGDLGDGAQLPRAQQRHRRNCNAACLENAEPAGDEPWVVGAPQQDSIPGHHAQLPDQHVSDLVGSRQQV